MPIGEKHYGHTISDHVASQIKATRRIATRKERAKYFNVKIKLIDSIDSGESWIHVSACELTQDLKSAFTHTTKLTEEQIRLIHSSQGLASRTDRAKILKISLDRVNKVEAKNLPPIPPDEISSEIKALFANYERSKTDKMRAKEAIMQDVKSSKGLATQAERARKLNVSLRIVQRIDLGRCWKRLPNKPARTEICALFEGDA